ncbi:MFS transporter [Desulfosporosinus sp. FKB]|uniref:MFS transporter n=1 Tax=Desulfosporosinus sp. FKB TaxID=1969835 RepID=UPI000B49D8FB|nr:MFS transporter [Desulfosporosinus sp. FKB]
MAVVTESNLDATVKTGGKRHYLDEARMCMEHYKFLIILALAYAFDQMDLFTFSFVAPALTKHWGASMEWIGIVNSCTFVGMLFGCWFGGWLSDVIGRRKAFLFSVFFFSVFSILNGVAPNPAIFLVFRTLTGFGILSMVVVAMVYITEILPAASRGKWQAISLATGLLSVPLIGQIAEKIVPSSPNGWRYIFFIGGTGFIIFILALSWLKESPRWLITKGRYSEAEKVIQRFIKDEKVDINNEASIDPANNAPKEAGTMETLKEIFSKKYARKTSVLVIMVCCITVGYFMFFGWMPTLLNDYGFSLDDALWMSALVSFGSPIGNYLAAFFTDKGGRKIPIVIYSLLVGVLTIVFGTLKIPMVIVGIGFFIRVLMDGVFVVMWSYLAEAYPTHIRTSGTGFIYSTGRLLTAVAMVVVPMIYKGFGYTVLFGIIGVMFLLVAVTTGLWGEKTAGRSLDELEA